MTEPRRLVGRDPAFRTALELARRAALSRGPVLLVGPSGSGKSAIARFIHRCRPGGPGPFEEWHAASVPGELFEAELLGVERGAATGVAPRAGLFERVAGGTVCLVGLELLGSGQQASLLRILEGRPFTRLGGSRPLTARCLVLAAFSDPPQSLLARGRLRQDLLFRLDLLRIDLPALADRPGDIPLLSRHFLRQACRRGRRPVPTLSPELLEALAAHPWPGNLRELAQRMESLALLDREVLTADDLPASFWLEEPAPVRALERRLTLEELKDAYIRFVLARVGGNRTRAARWLGISRKALWAHLRRGSP
ncbi:MAG: sigma 54-interacting transcriptional regulator [Acidobacteriota bacterium]